MVPAAAAAALNHLLAGAGWARDSLRPFAGSVVALRVGPASLRLAVAADGLVAEAPAETAAALSVEMDPLTALGLLAGDPAARQRVRTSGNEALARALWPLVRHLRWDAAEDLSHVVGDVAAERLAGTARAARRHLADGALRGGQALAEAVSEEARLVVPAPEVAAFCADVDQLRDAAARLEQRLAALEKRCDRAGTGAAP